jgi:cytochrome c oxidase cbb3-type subunit IV
MRYIKHFFEDIAGIEIYPMISLLIFFIFFLGLGVYVIRMRKQHARYMAAIPLETKAQNQPESSSLDI